MEACKACQKPLTLLVHSEDEQDGYLPDVSSSTHQSNLVDDDVELQCGCHFHWQCLLDAYNITECPNCRTDLLEGTESGVQQVICNIKNEGGLQEGLDILPLLTEECYLKAFPEERRCRAFLEFCREGDIEAIVDLLDDDDDDGDDEEDNDDNGGQNGEEVKENRIDVLRYQDPTSSMDSALHIAITHGRTEVAWLLLLLASNLPMSQFPPEILQAADRLHLVREDQSGKTDIRTVEDDQGMTGAQRALYLEETWGDWATSGRLTA